MSDLEGGQLRLAQKLGRGLPYLAECEDLTVAAQEAIAKRGDHLAAWALLRNPSVAQHVKEQVRAVSLSTPAAYAYWLEDGRSLDLNARLEAGRSTYQLGDGTLRTLIEKAGGDVGLTVLHAPTWKGDLASLVEASKDPVRLEGHSHMADQELGLHETALGGLRDLDAMGRVFLPPKDLHPLTQDLLVRVTSNLGLIYHVARHPGLDHDHQGVLHTFEDSYVNLYLGDNPNLDPSLEPHLIRDVDLPETLSQHNSKTVQAWCAKEEVAAETVLALAANWTGNLQTLVEAARLVHR